MRSPSIFSLRRGLWVGVSLLFLAFAAVAPAQAQDAGRVSIAAPDFSKFPDVQFNLEAYNAAGDFLDNLSPGEVQVLEDGKPQSLVSLEKVEPGLQIIVALNNAPIFAERSGNNSVFELIQNALVTWAQTQPAASPDDLSLVTNTGLQFIRMENPQEWAVSLAAYNADFRTSQPGTVSINQALDMATDPNPDPNMKRAILYITPLPGTTEVSALPNLASRAKQQGARLFVWMVAPASALNTTAAKTLYDAALSTGGQFFHYTGSEQLPNLDGYFKSMRYIYTASYRSAINQSGTHSLAVQINRGDLQAVSEAKNFELNILPPNPIFLSPPAEVTRAWIKPSQPGAKARLDPISIEIPILIEFPDGYQHPIVRTQLYVDGVLAAENTQPPFDRFQWPLSEYTSSASHQLQIKVEDELGLSQSSIETTVQVTVEPQPGNILAGLTGWRRIVLVSVLGLTALVAALVILMARGRGLSLLQRFQQRKLYQDPVTQPVVIPQDAGDTRRSAAAPAPTTPRPRANMNAPARLVRLTEDGHALTENVILLTHSEITLGCDPGQAICVIDSSSIEGLHARIVRTSDGSFYVSDAGSVAGTWINYAPVSKSGAKLEHGDILHLGRVSFRFEYSNPTHIRKPVVEPYQGGRTI